VAEFILPANVAVGDPVQATHINDLNAAAGNLDSRVASIEGLTLPNGSFEKVEDGQPVLWTVSDLGSAGATHAVDSTTQGDGLKSLKCSITATGGYVEAENDTLLPVYEGARVEVPFSLKSDLATARARINIIWLEDDESVISDLSVFDENTNIPSSFETRSGIFVSLVAPATARWFKIKAIAGESGNSVVANVYFDSIRPRIYRGFVPVDQSLGAALLTSGLSTNLKITMPASIIGTEIPHTAVVDVYCEWSGGVSTMTFSENSSGGGKIYGVIFSDTVNLPLEGWFPQKNAPIRQRDLSFNVFETGGGNMLTRRIYLAGYYV
jgi:hypothetical protein